MRFLRQNTAVQIVVGPMIDWMDGKTLMRLNDDFYPDALNCELVKGSTGSNLTLTKTGGSNTINLSGNGLAVLSLTVVNTDTARHLRLFFSNAIVEDYPTDTILPFTEDFIVLNQDAYDALINGDLAEPDGVASSLWQKINQTWHRFFKKHTCSSTELKTYKADGSVNTTQAVQSEAGVETVGDAE